MNKVARAMLMSGSRHKGRESGEYRDANRYMDDGRHRDRDGYSRREREYRSGYEDDYSPRDTGHSERQRREHEDYRDYERDMDRDSHSRGMRIEGHAGRGEDGDYYASGRLMPEDEEPEKLTYESAKKWLDKMQNEDGSKGPHWTFEQAKQLMEQKKIDCDPVEFWVALNMMFSDYGTVAKKNNASTVDFYADMAKAFLCDKDAKSDKLERYYRAIVK